MIKDQRVHILQEGTKVNMSISKAKMKKVNIKAVKCECVHKAEMCNT